MRKTTTIAGALLVAWFCATPTGWAQTPDDDAAASEAVKEHKGYRVVSVMPALKDGHPVADVILVKGADWKTVSERLD